MIQILENFSKKLMAPFFIGIKDLENKGFKTYFMVYARRDNGTDKPDDYMSTYIGPGINDDDKDNIVAVQAGQGMFNVDDGDITLFIDPLVSDNEDDDTKD